MHEATCPHCKKRIEGFTIHHIDYLLKQHILSKHPDQISMNEKK